MEIENSSSNNAQIIQTRANKKKLDLSYTLDQWTERHRQSISSNSGRTFFPCKHIQNVLQVLTSLNKSEKNEIISRP
jgi:hypothetical protein